MAFGASVKFRAFTTNCATEIIFVAMATPGARNIVQTLSTKRQHAADKGHHGGEEPPPKLARHDAVPDSAVFKPSPLGTAVSAAPADASATTAELADLLPPLPRLEPRKFSLAESSIEAARQRLQDALLDFLTAAVGFQRITAVRWETTCQTPSLPRGASFYVGASATASGVINLSPGSVTALDKVAHEMLSRFFLGEDASPVQCQVALFACCDM